MPAYEELTATDLLRRWRQLVNGNSASGRDGSLLKNYLVHTSPIQVLLGMYQYRSQRTISIPQFLHESSEWLEPDIAVAKIELARCVSNKTPLSYYVWMDNKEEELATAQEFAKNAWETLVAWSDGVLA